MPSYITHSIHGELIHKDINRRVNIDVEDLKTYNMGPDAMILTDYKTFSYQHANKTREFFMTLIDYIKDNHLEYNSEVMGFLYAQLDHYILDITTHPLIYYMTEDLDMGVRFPAHGLIENWIDDYIVKKYGIDNNGYYKKKGIKDNSLKYLLDYTYETVYHVKNESKKYNNGIKSILLYDSLIRRKKLGITPLLIDLFNVGDITYSEDIQRVVPYLNLDRDVWTNPINCTLYTHTFDDLFNKSINTSLSTIEDVNEYIYDGKLLYNYYINNNISYNTGLACELGENFRHVKKYHK